MNIFSSDEKTNNTELEEIKKIIEKLDEKKDNVPIGAVMYFDLDACPENWEPLIKKYPNAKNSFIRNLSGTNRKLGEWQENAAPEIQGSFDGNINDSVYGYSADTPTGSFYYTQIQGIGADGNGAEFSGHIGFKASLSSDVYGRKDSSGKPTTEIRPDNISLLACRKYK